MQPSTSNPCAGAGAGAWILTLALALTLLEYLIPAPSPDLGLPSQLQDAEGSVIKEAPWSHVTHADLSEAALALTGDIQQRPPIFSAIKRDGKRVSNPNPHPQPHPRPHPHPNPNQASACTTSRGRVQSPRRRWSLAR